MALIIYPDIGYDSFITEVDATTHITNTSLQAADWIALTIAEREIYLRIATTRIFNVISTDSSNSTGYLDGALYDATLSCLPKTTATMAGYDLVYGISKDINPNTGLVSKEKVGDLEVEYYHGQITGKAKSRRTNPFPSSTIACLASYGANINTSGMTQATLVRS